MELTPRELEVLALFLCGLNTRQIAGRRGVSFHTTRHQAASLHRKLVARDAHGR
jgi:DNA-binding NarL/FixJ family response regulator